jgi:hypothetical protein
MLRGGRPQNPGGVNTTLGCGRRRRSDCALLSTSTFRLSLQKPDEVEVLLWSAGSLVGGFLAYPARRVSRAIGCLTWLAEASELAPIKTVQRVQSRWLDARHCLPLTPLLSVPTKSLDGSSVMQVLLF